MTAELFHADGQTDRQYEANISAFRTFAKAPKSKVLKHNANTNLN